jgi:hypothetical protein
MSNGQSTWQAPFRLLDLTNLSWRTENTKVRTDEKSYFRFRHFVLSCFRDSLPLRPPPLDLASFASPKPILTRRRMNVRKQPRVSRRSRSRWPQGLSTTVAASRRHLSTTLFVGQPTAFRIIWTSSVPYCGHSWDRIPILSLQADSEKGVRYLFRSAFLSHYYRPIGRKRYLTPFSRRGRCLADP